MREIEGLQKGSKLTVWIVDQELKQVTVDYWGEGDFFCDDIDGILRWQDIFSTPREAIVAEIKKQERKVKAIQKRIAKLDRMLKTDYALHPILSKEEFTEKYPYLNDYYRTEDISHQELEKMNRQEEWDRRYDRY